MSEIKKLTKLVNKWVSERGWEKYQKPKDLAISLSLEAAEVLEHFQWKNERQFQNHLNKSKESYQDELADVFTYLLKLADKTHVDLSKAVKEKLTKASKKYPVKTMRSNSSLSEYYKIKKQVRKRRKK